METLQTLMGKLPLFATACLTEKKPPHCNYTRGTCPTPESCFNQDKGTQSAAAPNVALTN